jgi:hypothetical protein
MKLYKRTFKGRSLADVQNEVGRSGGVVVRIDQDGDSTTAYFEADDRIEAAAKADAKEASLDEVTKI